MQNAKQQMNLMYKCLKNKTKHEMAVGIQGWGQSWGPNGRRCLLITRNYSISPAVYLKQGVWFWGPEYKSSMAIQK